MRRVAISMIAGRHTSESNFNITSGFAITPPDDVPAPATLLLIGAATTALAGGRTRRSPLQGDRAEENSSHGERDVGS